MSNTLISKSTTPTLTWAAISGASQYEIQFAIDQRFSVISQDLFSSSATVTPSALTDLRKWFWRFRALLSSTLYVDQSNLTGAGTGNALRDAAERTYLAESFIAGSGFPIKRVTLSLKKTSAPTGDMWVEIWSSSAGAPVAIIGSASANLDVSTLTGSYVSYNLDFASPIPVRAGTTYFLVVRGNFTIDGVNYVQWQTDAAGSYSSGAAYKGDGSAIFSTNGTPDQIFSTSYNRWGAWQPLRSLFILSTAAAAYTPPTTGWVLIDRDDTTDYYELPVAPEYEIDPEQKRRSDVTTIQGNALIESVSIRDVIALDFQAAYISYEHLAEWVRFFNKRKAFYLVAVTDYIQDKQERIWLVNFTSDNPVITPIAPGREDYFHLQVKLKETSLA